MAEFRLTERDYRYLFENASDAMWVHDMEGNILDGNKAFGKLTGYTLGEWAGMNVSQFLTDEFQASAREARRKLCNGEDLEQPYEQQLVRRDGTTRTVKLSTSSIIISGEVKGFQHVARDVTEEKQLEESKAFYVDEVIRAQEHERKRIARGLHDDVSPPLLLLAQGLDTLTSAKRQRLSESLLKQTLEKLRSQAIDALESLRCCAQGLRPRILDDLGLVAALEWMTDDLVKTREIDAYFEIVGVEQTLPAETQLLLFRIAQEALNNTKRHAQASRAVVTLEFQHDNLKMTVNDNGKGFELPKRIGDWASIGQLGLAGMQERARLIGGRLAIKSEIGKGTTVAIEVPIKGSLSL